MTKELVKNCWFIEQIKKTIRVILLYLEENERERGKEQI